MKKRVARKNKRKINPWLYWSPRVLTILFILFISMFTFDVFENNQTFWQILLALFMHLIPSFVLIIFLIIAWKWELVGAIAFAMAGLLYMGIMIMNAINYHLEFYMLSYSLIIAGPSFIAAFLWWLNWIKKKK